MYKLSKVIIRNSVLIVILLLSFVFGIQTLKKYKIYNKDKEVIANQNISFIDNEVSQNTGEESNDGDLQNRENINTATTKQNLIYTSYENDLYADNAKDVENMLNKWNYLREDGKKVAYLTFDDGPSTEVTQQILETLKFNNIKAPFFVLGSNVEKSNIQKELLKEMVIEGHAIGNHGYCHDYSILYPSRVANPTVIVNDMKKSEYVMRSVLGDDFRTSVIRLPGGHMSWNTKMLDPVLEENGYSYIDWNTLNGDAEGNDRTVEQLVNRLKGTIRDLAENDDVLVILMHDTNAKKTTSQ
ncbi:MAG: polysaccharide deacetylase family protein, partial [Clostridium celatum]|nr:polysaccharide deacetylase family protein [Clostridium celatum]